MNKETKAALNLSVQKFIRGKSNWPEINLNQLKNQWYREAGYKWNNWNPIQVWVGRGFFDPLRKELGKGNLSIHQVEQNIRLLWLNFLAHLIEMLTENKEYTMEGDLRLNKIELIEAMWYLIYWMLEDNLIYPGLPTLFGLTYLLSQDIGFEVESMLGWEQMKQEIAIKYSGQLQVERDSFMTFDQSNRVWELKELGIKIERKMEGGKVKWEIDLIEEENGQISC